METFVVSVERLEQRFLKHYMRARTSAFPYLHILTERKNVFWKPACAYFFLSCPKLAFCDVLRVSSSSKIGKKVLFSKHFSSFSFLKVQNFLTLVWKMNNSVPKNVSHNIVLNMRQDGSVLGVPQKKPEM